MRIIEVLSFSPPEIFIARHILALQETTVQPIMVACYEMKHPSPQGASVINIGINLGKVHIPVNTNQFSSKLLSLRHLLKPHSHIDGSLRERVFSAYIENLHPDLIHFHMGTLAGRLFKIPLTLKIPYSISLRGSDVQVIPFESPQKFSALQLAIQSAAGVHTVSDALWKICTESLGIQTEKIYQQTIYTTVPLDFYQTEKQINIKKKFIAVGRLHWSKAFPLLLIAFKRLLMHQPNSELVIIGDGDMKDCLGYWIRHLSIQNNVTLLGQMNYPDLKFQIQKADGFIQSSIAEGFSNATAEAMALGCPVFATDVGGTSEIIQEGVNGFLLDPISPENWVEKLLLINDDVLMSSIRENARKTAVQKFSSMVHADKFIAFYTKVLQPKAEKDDQAF